MELNISNVPPSKEASSFSTSQYSAKQKGSWKKKRKKAVLTRNRYERRHGLREGAKKNAPRTGADEFASGLEATSDPKKEEPKDDSNSGKRQSSGQYGAARSSDNRKRQRIGENVQEAKTFKLMGSANSIKAPDTEEAIGATLEMVGGHLADKHFSMQKVRDNADDKKDNDKENEETGAQEDEMQTRKEETFGTGDFESIGLYASVARHLQLRMQMEKPTQIQERVIKAMLNLPEGAAALDVLVRSATGSGKTLSYLLPVAHYLLDRRKRVTREDGALAIVILPTRELAEQVESVAVKVFRPWHWIVIGSVRGGEGKKSEKARLRKGTNVLVATPGRLLDHIRNTRSFQYTRCEFLVLDEADRLLDLGFEADIKDIIGHLNSRAQFGVRQRSNIMLSATMRADVERLAKFSLDKPIQITAEKEDNIESNKFRMPSQLRQHLCVVEQRHRLVTLAAFLRLRAIRGVSQRSLDSAPESLPQCKIMVFFSTCDSVDFHFDILGKVLLPKVLIPRALKSDERLKVVPIDHYRLHGGMEQAERIKSLRAFRECRRGVLLCTDVAARGLDLPGVGFSVQYDPPTGGQDEELEYVHRAGRTARMGERGDALLFLLPSERAYKSKLENTGVTIKEISNNTALAALLPGVEIGEPERVSYAARLVTSEVQEAFELIVKGDSLLKGKAYAGYVAYCRAYATHSRDVKHYFHVRNLHLGHVARAFALVDKPADLGGLLADIKAAKEAAAAAKDELGKMVGTKRMVAKAIAEGEQQPFNDQNTALARRRRERGKGKEAYKELASEFAS